MKTLTAIVHRGEPEEGGFWATCLEVPGANGQGQTKEECLDNLKEAIQLLLAARAAVAEVREKLKRELQIALVARVWKLIAALCLNSIASPLIPPSWGANLASAACV
jgi:predicted RNase H-like HicB family nuclease